MLVIRFPGRSKWVAEERIIVAAHQQIKRESVLPICIGAGYTESITHFLHSWISRQ
jgi:hypothetical protein